MLQATSPARRDAGQPLVRVAGQSGQYLPGLAPATELRKRASELRQQHLAKLQRLAGGQVASSMGNSPGEYLSLLHALIHITFLYLSLSHTHTHWVAYIQWQQSSAAGQSLDRQADNSVQVLKAAAQVPL